MKIRKFLMTFNSYFFIFGYICIFRRIFGPTKEANGIWRIKTKKELDELIKHRNIIK